MNHSLPYYIIYKRKEKQKKEENYTKGRNYTKKSPPWESSQYRIFIDQGGTKKAIRGHASKLDTWPHSMVVETRSRLRFCHYTSVMRALPGCAHHPYYGLLVQDIILAFSALRISRLGFKLLGFF